MTGAPLNLDYSLEDSNFELQQTFDLSLRGEYLINLQASAEGPDGIVNSAVIKLTLYFNPCRVDYLNVSPSSLAPIKYTLGGPGFDFGAYEFTQDLPCGYEQ